VISERQNDWSDYVSYVTFCYNASVHSATNFSPHFLMTGREPRWTVDLCLGLPVSNAKPISEYAAALVERMQVAHDLARKHLAESALTMANWYDKKVRLADFQVGDKVLVYYPRRYKGRSVKWQRCYSTEGVVTKRLNDVTFLIESKAWRLPKIVHVDKLKVLKSFSA
jgi:hypothetical protein